MLLALLPWFSLMAAGLVTAVALLVWGHRSGQFAAQDRARYLPLRDAQDAVADKGSGRLAPEVYVLVGLVAVSGLTLALALGLALFKQHGG